MALNYHPETGTIVICDFHGYVAPEMVKRRPAIVVSPRFRNRAGLCTIVPLSTTAPTTVMSYHHKLHMVERLPPPYNSPYHWVKADMFSTVALTRLSFPHSGKDINGKRNYVVQIVDDIDLRDIRACMLHAIGLSHLTGHL